MKRICPRGLMADMRLSPKRAPVVETMGVLPRLQIMGTLSTFKYYKKLIAGLIEPA
jgi:hypothetical protein